MKGIVVLGDKTTHGGQVISVSSSMVINGKKVALVGDKINCPVKGHGINTIIEGSFDWISDGKQVVVNGCRCECGCVVISSIADALIG
ncbi:PAAR domain-containing protein [Escherichia coli]|uniref:PAAR domain-containing protein n=1 Tax=Escherichia coli TaxID=562 RepID=UPI00038F70FE|nr:PAAR domain-containing protein [Escherichia coli]EFW8106678.1 PAAR domain-containing protein [Shigella sonnei]EIG6219646.1 PAAR domain-containing protein [Shigella dysenteriae]EIH4991809.1 PAAR domain-containing protein [Shigella boydii]HDL6813455.1 PAAR domain-containing protein [Escherichia coli 371_08]HDL6818580.1 PAAR domain-containing protein [Escherichia coli 290_10]HDL6833471.1 PAAR domain-containing protein [Escherichia coli 229_11]HDL7561442.1 PAAR domain-containing protein [Esch